jgi:hypothetical protein
LVLIHLFPFSSPLSSFKPVAEVKYRANLSQFGLHAFLPITFDEWHFCCLETSVHLALTELIVARSTTITSTNSSKPSCMSQSSVIDLSELLTMLSLSKATLSRATTAIREPVEVATTDNSEAPEEADMRITAMWETFLAAFRSGGDGFLALLVAEHRHWCAQQWKECTSSRAASHSSPYAHNNFLHSNVEEAARRRKNPGFLAERAPLENLSQPKSPATLPLIFEEWIKIRYTEPHPHTQAIQSRHQPERRRRSTSTTPDQVETASELDSPEVSIELVVDSTTADEKGKGKEKRQEEQGTLVLQLVEEPRVQRRSSGGGGGTHLWIFVHGLAGNLWDLHLLRNHIALRHTNCEFLLCGAIQRETLNSIEVLGAKIASEIAEFVAFTRVEKISFVGHSLGGLIVRQALTTAPMKPFIPLLYNFVSFSVPHLGSLYSSSALVSGALRLWQKVTSSKSLQEVCLQDHPDPRETLVFRLSQAKSKHRHLHHTHTLAHFSSSTNSSWPALLQERHLGVVRTGQLRALFLCAH